MKTLTLQISGMSCGHCLNAVNKALNGIPGAQPTSVQIGRAVIEYDESTVSPELIATAVRDSGYEVISSREVP